MVWVEIAIRPMRSPRSVAIGASSTGGALDLDAGLGDAERVDPADLGEQAEHLPEGEDDADQQHRDDDAVQARIGEEGLVDLAVENERDEAGDDQEYDHPPQIDLRRRELVRVVLARAARSEQTQRQGPFSVAPISYSDLAPERNGKIAAVRAYIASREGLEPDAAVSLR